MYALIIFIHAIFISIAHLLGYRIFEGIFFLLGLFFLFYFSPLFFIDADEPTEKGKTNFSPKNFLTELSPKNSLLLPVTLLYIAIYGFLFALFRIEQNILLYHAIIIAAIYILFFIYSIIFYWKSDIFFELLRFHTLFTLISTIVFMLSLLMNPLGIHVLHPLIGLIGIIAGTFLLSYTKQENPIFLWSYLAAIFATIIMAALWLFPGILLVKLCAIGIVFGIFAFEYLPTREIYFPYTTIFRYFSLVSILLFLLPVFYIAFDTIDSLAIFLLILTAGFFLTIHRRYTNYVVFIIAILEIFFIYGLVFSGLLLEQDLFSLFLFLFFLPVLVIGSTFFWEEDHPYDFVLLHYSSIAFSIIFSVYSIFFIGWGDELLFVISLCIFGTAILFFLSYFRFHEEKNWLQH